MNIAVFKNFPTKTLFVICLLCLTQTRAAAQITPEPDRTRLLNGLRVLILTQPADPDVLIKLRIHSGAAFDLAGKGGSMALLGDILFPDPTIREYFTDEMQGRLNVTTDYDTMTITMQGKARDFERIVEILRTAVVTPQLTPENIARAREGRIKVIRDSSVSPASVADRAIAARLYGDFPYGRPYNGSPESLERVERGDLLLTRERFLNPNNATLVILGGVQTNRAIRALRQLLGIWRKTEQIVPATFRQPPPPDPRTLIINAPAEQSIEIRLAVRGLARADPDSPTAALLAAVARQRWEKLIPDLSRSPVFVRHDAYTLPGIFVMGTTVDHLLASKVLTTAQEAIKSLVTAPASFAELEQARSEMLALKDKELGRPDGLADAWLDMDTYGVPATTEQLRLLGLISANDLQRVATRLLRDASFASVVVGNSELVKTQIERHGKVELMGALEPKVQTKSNESTSKSPTNKPE